MIHFILGGVSVLSFIFLYHFIKKREIQMKWWGWSVTILGFVYTIFVIEVIIAFLEEGASRGALVMGLLLGIIAIIWGVLTSRFVFHLNRR